MAKRKTEKQGWWDTWVVKHAGAIAVLVSAAGWGYKFSDKNAAFNLEKTKKEYEGQIAQLKSQFESLPRGVGEQKLLDLDRLIVTPDQARQLSQQYALYELDKVQFYLSLPSAPEWSFEKTTEEDLASLVYQRRQNNQQSHLASDQINDLHEIATKQVILLWKYNSRVEAFEVPTTESSIASIRIFPYAAIEFVKNDVATQRIFPNLRSVSEKTASFFDEMFKTLDQAIAALSRTSYALSEISKRHPELPSFTPPSFTNIRHPSKDQLQAGMNELILTSVGDLAQDPPAFWASSEISSNLRRAAKIQGASFKVLHAEKNGRIFQLLERFTFPAQESNQERYWDLEIIYIGAAEGTLVVTLSDPWSLSQQPGNFKWTATWLSGLRIALAK
jgi:hypothetical protein